MLVFYNENKVRNLDDACELKKFWFVFTYDFVRLSD